MMLNKTDIKNREIEFQECQSKYRASGDKPSWNRMWTLIYDTCSNIAKSKLKGVVVNEFDGKCMDATCIVMEKIRNGTDVGKMSSFCYFPVIGTFFNRKEQAYDRCVSLEELQDSTGDYCTHLFSE